MQAGTLRHKLVFKRPSETSGDAAVTEPIVATVRGELQGLGGTDVGLAVSGEYRMRIRYRSGLRPQMIVTHGSRRFQVNSLADPDGRRRELVVSATELQ